MYLVKLIQSLSGLTFASFSTLHLAGHLLTNFSFTLGNQALFANREIFQHPIVELGVIGGSLILHTLSSAYLFSRRSPQKESNIEVVRTKQLEIKLHRSSGYILAAAMFAHISATRLIPLRVLDDASVMDLTFITHSFQNSIMYPYYFILGSAGMYHTCYGIVQSLNLLGISSFQVKPGQWLLYSKVCAAIMVSTVLALSGSYENVSIPLREVFERVDFMKFVINIFQ
jgi:succinate dehydrogenase/fumarate reductase cytochrome b subunit